MARRKTPPTRAARLHALLDSTLGRVLTRVTVCALVFLLAGIVMRQARAYTYRLDDFRVQKEKITFVDLPDWVDGRMQYALQPGMFPEFSVSIYDPRAEDAIRGHAAQHPFVREIESVRVLYPNRAEVKPRLRVPVARVRLWRDVAGNRMAERVRLLSDDGCLLPAASYRNYLTRLPYELPLLTGITERPPRDPGETWEDGSGRVAEGIAAAQLAERIFRDFGGRVSVVRVDVSRFPAAPAARERGEVRLVISCPGANGRVQRTVEWGRTERARADVRGEDDYVTKLKRLMDALSKPRPASHIDVRFQVAIGPRTAQ